MHKILLSHSKYTARMLTRSVESTLSRDQHYLPGMVPGVWARLG